MLREPGQHRVILRFMNEHEESFGQWRERQKAEGKNPPKPPIRRGRPELEYDRSVIVKMYFTYPEVAALCFRSVDLIKHLTTQHKLARVIIEPERNEKGKRGRGGRKIALLPAETVNALRRMTIGL